MRRKEGEGERKRRKRSGSDGSSTHGILSRESRMDCWKRSLRVRRCWMVCPILILTSSCSKAWSLDTSYGSLLEREEGEKEKGRGGEEGGRRGGGREEGRRGGGREGGEEKMKGERRRKGKRKGEGRGGEERGRLERGPQHKCVYLAVLTWPLQSESPFG